jgi:hypothetical protein
MTPSPGSDEAIAQGCSCPAVDNAHGEGHVRSDGTREFWTYHGCPLHGLPPH